MRRAETSKAQELASGEERAKELKRLKAQAEQALGELQEQERVGDFQRLGGRMLGWG